MAEEVIALKVSLDAADSANSVRDLKKAIKELENAALEAGNKGDEALSRKYAAAAGAAKDKMADFKKEIQGVSDAGSKLGAIANVGATIASGFQAAQGAAALFGASGKDVEKVLLKVQAATALAQGAQALANATEDIAIAKKVIYTTVTETATAAVTFFGTASAAAWAAATAGITIVIGLVAALVYQLSLANDEEEKNIKLEEQRLDLLKRRSEESDADQTQLDRNFQRNRARLEAEGKSEAELFELEQTYRGEKIFELQQFNEKLDKTKADEQEIIRKNNDKIEQLQIESDVKYFGRITQRNNKEKDAAIKQGEELAKIKIQTEREKETDIVSLDSNKQLGPTSLESTELAPQVVAEVDITNRILKEKKRLEDEEKIDAERRKERQKRNAQFGIEATRAGLQAISDLVVATAGKSEAAQRRAFNFQKGVNIATTTIDTYLAAQKAYASQIIPADPSSVVRGAIAAGIAITSGLARVAIIARTQFNSGGGSPSTAGGGGESGSISGGGGPSGIPTPATSILGEGGQVTNITGNQNSKVYVTETDISATMKRVNVIEARAKVG